MTNERISEIMNIIASSLFFEKGINKARDLLRGECELSDEEINDFGIDWLFDDSDEEEDCAKQIIFRDLENDKVMAGIKLPNGEVVCCCCGAVYPPEERGKTFEIILTKPYWQDIQTSFASEDDLDIIKSMEQEANEA